MANDSAVKAALLEELERHRADRVQTQAEILRGDLVERLTVTSVFGGIFATWRGQVTDLDMIQGDTLAAILGGRSESAHVVRKALSDTAYETIEKITSGMKKYVRDKL